MFSNNRIESRIYETTKTYDSVYYLCHEAKEKGFSSIQVFPCMIAQCKQLLDGSTVMINSLISYPHGGFSIDQKAAEAKEASEYGAAMVEVVVNTREIKSHNYDYIFNEMDAVKRAVGKEIFVKFNIEIESLTDEEAVETCKMAIKANIDFISTSTGLYHTLDDNKNDVPLVTTEHEIVLLKSTLGNSVKIQAEGNISDNETANKLLLAGADIISTEYASYIVR